MPLKRKKEAEEAKKNQGGKTMTEEEIRSIALAVKNMLTEDKEKETVGQQLGEMKKLLCAPDGGPCFLRKEDFDRYMAEQAKKDEERRQEQKKTIDGLDSKIGEVVSQVKQLKPAPTPAALEEVKPLEKMTAGRRSSMREEENKARDGQVDKIEDYFNVTDNDRWRKLRRNEVNLDGIAKKQEMRKRVFDGITDQELKDVTLMACRGDKCQPFRQGLEKEAGIKFYSKDERGRWQPVDQPKREPSRI